jgi:hypothetical protein
MPSAPAFRYNAAAKNNKLLSPTLRDFYGKKQQYFLI